MKHIVCYSGGHSSAIVAIEVVRRYGKENCILLNHDINKSVESEDIKRFKIEVADYLDVPITYANHPQYDTKDQFDVCIDAKAFKVGNGTALCTNRLKTKPFEKYLASYFPISDNAQDVTIYYGFDKNEKSRIQRRIGILSNMGYKSDYPLAFMSTEDRAIFSTTEIGIKPPNTYGNFKHANCVGCLKAGKQHWYIVYLTRSDIWEKAKLAEDIIGYTIHKDQSLEELEPIFSNMQKANIVTTEHEKAVSFFARIRREYPEVFIDNDEKPCECTY